jgi:hypothetical protein
LRCQEGENARISFFSEVLPSERDALIRMGLLNKVARNDKKAVREALYELFEKHLDPETPPPSPVSGYQGVYS